MMKSVFQVEIDFPGHPVLVALGQQGGDETQAGRGIGEDGGHASAALDLAIDAFEAVGGAQARPLRQRQLEDRKAFRQVVLGPLGELGCIGAPRLDRLLQEALGLGAIRGIEDRPNPLRHGFALIEAGDIGLGVLLQVKLAALPGNAGQRFASMQAVAFMTLGAHGIERVSQIAKSNTAYMDSPRKQEIDR